LVEFRAGTIEDVVGELGLDVKPNTLTQRLVRGKQVKNPYAKLPISDYAASHFVCIVILNGRATLKILCSAEASPEQVEAALKVEREKSVRTAVKNAKRDGLSDESICEAIDRINVAYQNSHIMYWLGSDDREDRFVINPPIDEGAQLVLNQTRGE